MSYKTIKRIFKTTALSAYMNRQMNTADLTSICTITEKSIYLVKNIE